MSLRPAATVMIFRQSPIGPEVLLLQRSRQVDFSLRHGFFLGGRVDDADVDISSAGFCGGRRECFWCGCDS